MALDTDFDSLLSQGLLVAGLVPATCAVSRFMQNPLGLCICYRMLINARQSMAYHT